MPSVDPELPCPACGAPVPAVPALEGCDRLHATGARATVAVCEQCGSGTTLPCLTEAELAAHYPDSYGPFLVAGGGLGAAASRAIQRWQGWRALRGDPLSAIRGASPGAALDVGCGRGDLGALLIERGWRVTGVEPSHTACAAARARGIDARRGTLADVELPASGYDVAIFQHSLEHVNEPLRDLRLARTALRDDGTLLVSLPNFDSWQRCLFGARWFHLDLPRHRTHFSAAGLERLLSRAGFAVDRLSTSTTAVGLPATLQYRLFGRCLFRGGLALRAAALVAALAYPLSRAIDVLAGGGDQTNAVARPARVS